MLSTRRGDDAGGGEAKGGPWRLFKWAAVGVTAAAGLYAGYRLFRRAYPAVRAELVAVPRKSAEDTRMYRMVELPNGLRCLLVSDPTSEKAAVALDVNVGHYADPDDLPGLAHFLEHMLFLGTRKYPDENSYSTWLSANGGTSNAYTSAESTCFYNQVSAGALAGTLDRFAQFFLEPLFTPSATEREMLAVHSENEKNIQNDSRRLYQLDKWLAPPSHPFHKFGTGNLETLRDTPQQRDIDTRTELLAFHAHYYSANIMRLCIVGADSLDRLERLACRHFAGIKELPGLRPPSIASHSSPFSHRTGTRLLVVPVKDLRELTLFFPFPGVRDAYETSPHRGISHLLGHEGPGSVFSVLRRRGWANGLTTYLSHSNEAFSLFSVGIALTESGLEHIEDIIKVVFAYVRLLKQLDALGWRRIYDELSGVAATSFRFKSKESPYHYACQLANRMQRYAPDDVISGGYLMPGFDRDAIVDLVAHLDTDNFFYRIVSQTFEATCDESERWYGTRYRVDHIDAVAPELLPSLSSILVDGHEAKIADDPEDNDMRVEWRQLASRLELPGPNEYISSDFALVNAKEQDKKRDKEENNKKKDPLTFSPQDDVHVPTVPTLLVSNAGMHGWHLADDEFFKPKTHLAVKVISSTAVANSSPKARVLTKLAAWLLADCLNEETYDALVCGLGFHMDGSSTGLTLSFSGYSHKLPRIVSTVTARVMAFREAITEDRFQVVREIMQRDMRNFAKEQPYRHASYAESLALEGKIWHHDLQLAALDTATLDDTCQLVEQLVRPCFLRCFLHGNVDEVRAREMFGDLQRTFGTDANALNEAERPLARSIKLKPRVAYYHRQQLPNEDEKNSATKIVFQLGPDTITTRARALVLAHIMDEPCYNQLRTVEQLGYIVWSGCGTRHGVLYMYVTVQASSYDADYLEQRIEVFLRQFGADLHGRLSDAEFKDHLRATIESRTLKAKSLGGLHRRFYTEIDRERLAFDKPHREVPHLQALTLADIAAFFDRYIAPDGPERTKLCIQLAAKEQPLPPRPTVMIPKANRPPECSYGYDAEEGVEFVDVSDMDARSMALFPNVWVAQGAGMTEF